jgi:predicted nucleotide-binding protein
MEASEHWHVCVEVRDAPPGSEIVVLDQTRDWIEQRILEPRRRGEAIALQGHELVWADIEYIRITRSQVPSAQLIAQVRAEDQASSVAFIGGPSDRWEAAAKADDVTDELITGPVGSASESGRDKSEADPRKVMVVHGRDEEARRAMFDFLRALGLAPQEWSALVAAAPYVGQVLSAAFKIAKAVVVLFTPDDEGWLKEEFRQADDPPEETQPTPQARPNVLFEAGMALGVHPDRTVLVELGKLRPFSDIYGRHVVRVNHTEKPLKEIASRLKTAGCDVDESGSDWAATRFPQR